MMKNIRKSVYYFLIKSKAKNTFDLLEIYHQYNEKNIRKLFHQGKILIETFFRPWHYGMSHLSQTALLHKQSN